MKLIRSYLAIVLNVTLVSATFLGFAIQSAPAQDSRIALQRGYRTGYSDGYMAGYRDVTQNLERNIQTHNEYSKADRAFSKSYGTLEDYRDGYQQGFESGYTTGFEKRDFDSTLPVEIKKRGTTTPAISGPVLNNNSTSNNSGAATTSTENINSTAANTEIMSPSTPLNTTDAVAQAPIPAMLDGQIIIIPKDTELIVELMGLSRPAKTGRAINSRQKLSHLMNSAARSSTAAWTRSPSRAASRNALNCSYLLIRYI